MKSVEKLHGIFSLSTFYKDRECVNTYFGEYKDNLTHRMNSMCYKLEGPVLQYDNIN